MLVRHLTIAIVLFLVAGPVKAQDLTTLRVSRPQGTFQTRGSRIYLTDIQVTVRNAGSVDATGIYVSATTPNGSAVSLDGPSALRRNKSATYTGTSYEIVTNSRKIKASASCDNCR